MKKQIASSDTYVRLLRDLQKPQRVFPVLSSVNREMTIYN
jgi:hypothetical protein